MGTTLVVQKFGGSSVADAQKILGVAARIAKRVDSGFKLIIVVSAMGKSTDGLIKLAREVSPDPDPREYDMLLSTGEQVSVSLVSMALKDLGVKSKSLNAFQAGIKTTKSHTQAKILHFDTNFINEQLKEYDVLVVTGFQGVTEDWEITTLGRGGSDTSAVALASALGVDCEIYSDVAGIYTTDPKLHPNAKKLKQVSYDEMLEMASLGAKVLHSRSVEIAKKFNINLYCGSTFSDEEGSYVVNEDILIEEPVVTGCSVTENETQVIIKKLPVDYSIVQNLFEKVAAEGLNVDMISMINTGDELVVSFTVISEKVKDLDAAITRSLSGIDTHVVEYHSDYLKLSVVGIGMKSEGGVAATFFRALKNIPVKLVTTSEIKISCLIDKQFKEEAVKNIVNAFNL
ncbi:MAG: aspartate kinase [Ignavibacteria bacterium]|nr:aspartate kinase [Ignavibacteria bacterium]